MGEKRKKRMERFRSAKAALSASGAIGGLGGEDDEEAKMKLKAWQDDALEQESGDEAESPKKSNLDTIVEMSEKKSKWDVGAPKQDMGPEMPEEIDALDAFMNELSGMEVEPSRY